VVQNTVVLLGSYYVLYLISNPIKHQHAPLGVRSTIQSSSSIDSEPHLLSPATLHVSDVLEPGGMQLPRWVISRDLV